jgi:hypothetical protein
MPRRTRNERRTSSIVATKDTMPRGDDRVIAVLTLDPLDSILTQGGSGDWVLNPDKANECKYLVCCRKQNWSNRKEGIEDRAAFLIGVVVGLTERPDSENARGQPRYLIKISDYATVNIPRAWGTKGRNPIAYRTTKDLGIDLHDVKFKPMPEAAGSEPAGPTPKRLTIADAKQALAESFGVSPEDIEITIRG